MSILTDLKAALEAKWEAEREHNLARRTNDHGEIVAAAGCVNRATDDLHAILTDDTIAALVAVAGRAREHMEAYEEQHGQFISDQWKAELSAAIREANVVEHRTAEALAAALAPLVKEADHE